MMTITNRRFVRIQTDIPGPKARALLKRKEANVPRGPFNTAPTFAVKGEGALLTDVDGNTFIDFAGAIGSLNAGHCPPRVVEAIKAQADRFLHTSYHVMMYESYIALAEKLNTITPGNHAKKTFFLNSGAEAVENAIKIARKYTGRSAVISFERGFHGRTLLAMSLTSKVKPYKYGFGPFAPETYRVAYPYYYRKPPELSDEAYDRELLERLERMFIAEVPAESVAAIIMEPVQGEGGFVVPSKRFVQGVREICDRYGILMIVDEIQTGFGRTGKMFAIEHYDVVPDLMTMSKSIAAGVPLSAVTGRAEIMEAPSPGEIGGTYGGSPLGCVAALEVIELLTREGLLERAEAIGAQLKERLRRMQERFPFIGDVRGLGAMVAIELVRDRQTKEPAKELVGPIIAESIRRGVIVMSAGIYSNVIRFLPPLVMTDDQLQEGMDILEEAVQAAAEGLTSKP